MRLLSPKFIFFLFLSFVISSFAFSQIELRNKVVDFSTLLPLEGANIYIQNTTIGTVSNSDGNFVLVVPEKHENDTLLVSSIGYKTFKTAISEFDSSFEIFLEEDVASIEEVVLKDRR